MTIQFVFALYGDQYHSKTILASLYLSKKLGEFPFKTVGLRNLSLMSQRSDNENRVMGVHNE